VSGRVDIDLTVIGFTACTCALTAVVAGLVPALHAGRRREDLTGARQSHAPAIARAERALAVTHIALGVALLTAAGLFVRSFVRLGEVDPGFERAGVIGFGITVPSDHPRAERRALLERVLEAIESIPGVTSAGWITSLPPEPRKGVFVPCVADDGNLQNPADRLVCNYQVASEGYFGTLGIRLVEGRTVDAADDDGRRAVAIVNDALARRAFPGAHAVGRRIRTSFDGSPREIVGVIEPIHDRGLAAPTVPTAYIPLKQTALSYGSVVVRSEIPLNALAGQIRTRVAAIDASLPLTGFETLDARVRASVGEPRFYAIIAGVCAAIAVLLVTLGLYGVVGHGVSRRTTAIGAEARAIRGMVLRQAVVLAAVGIPIGVLGGLTIARMSAALLFEVGPYDPATFAVGAALVLAVTLVASDVPARRASRLDPATALRHD
jgi:predicted permease